MIQIRLSNIRCLPLVIIPLLWGCSASNPDAKSNDDSAMIEAGYTRSPVITSIRSVDKNEVIIKGVTMPDGRARFLHMGQAIGFTADSKGRFEAVLPVDDSGDIYEFEIEDRGRLVKAEGMVFIPCCDVSHAVLLRPGASSVNLGGAKPVISSVDVNGGQAISVAGYVKPSQYVTLYLNETKSAQTIADSHGRYEFLTDISHENIQRITVETAQGRNEKVIDLTRQSYDSESNNQIINTPQAWVLNWSLVGGGNQTAYIFK